jgi:hypothetical protein
MLSFTKISGKFFQNGSRTRSRRHRSSSRLGLEALEGRDLMSVISPSVDPPPGRGTMPPVVIKLPPPSPPPVSH